MRRKLTIYTLFLTFSVTCWSQSRDATTQSRDARRLDALTMETEELKRVVADQARRIAELEREVKALQNPPISVSPIPAPTPAWFSPVNWSRIKKDMSEADVVEILGPPTTVQSAVDTRTLFYASDSHSPTTLNGSVTLTDDRVTMMTPPKF
jgi:hypothetical protein